MCGGIDDDIFRRALLSLLAPGPGTGGSTLREKAPPREKVRSVKRLERSDERDAAPPAEPVLERFEIVEQLSSKALSICWSDSRSGRCGEQIWRFGLARQDSFCVLTGAAIRRGDHVFQPRSTDSHFAANRDRMILASSVPVFSEDAALE